MSKIIRTESAKAKGKEVSFEIVEECFALPKRKNGNVIRLDYASWNGNEPKYELRLWKEKDGEITATKGIGLTGEELIMLRELLNKMEEE